MSNCCMRRSAKFHVDSAVRFWATANIREGGFKRPPPGQARVNTYTTYTPTLHRRVMWHLTGTCILVQYTYTPLVIFRSSGCVGRWRIYPHGPGVAVCVSLCRYVSSCHCARLALTRRWPVPEAWARHRAGWWPPLIRRDCYQPGTPDRMAGGRPPLSVLYPLTGHSQSYTRGQVPDTEFLLKAAFTSAPAGTGSWRESGL